MPDSFESLVASVSEAVTFAPPWLLDLLILGAAVVAGLIVHAVVYAVLRRVTAADSAMWQAVVANTRGPARFALVAGAIALAADLAPLSRADAAVVQHLLLLCLIVLLAWMAQTALNILVGTYLRRFKLDAADNLLARKHVTQTRILRRVATTLIWLVAIAAGLMTFNGVRQYGVSLLASAGAAGIVLGLALQPLLKNLFAGIQLAVTQPIRIDDALLVEGEWGNVEEITSTYIVVRLWDWRRLILPLGYFLEKPFQNWTHRGADLIGTVMIYLDYRAPLPAIRRKVDEILKASSLWDHNVVAVQVTDFKEQTMEVRILASASNAGRAFDLRCEIREQLIAFLQKDYPWSLPRLRADVSEPDQALDDGSAHARSGRQIPERVG